MTDTTLTPQAARDTDTPDLGFHAVPLDYLACGVSVASGVTVRATNGVAVGLQGTYGLSLQTGGHVTGEGTPLQMNRFASLANVQEQPLATGGATFLQLNSGSIFPRMDFRFTDFSLGQGKNGTLLDTGASNFPFERLSFQDSWLHDGAISLSPATASPVTAAFTNNILDRCKLTISRGSTTPFSACFYNNLFLGDPNSATPGTPPALALPQKEQDFASPEGGHHLRGEALLEIQFPPGIVGIGPVRNFRTSPRRS